MLTYIWLSSLSILLMAIGDINDHHQEEAKAILSQIKALSSDVYNELVKTPATCLIGGCGAVVLVIWLLWAIGRAIGLN